MYDFVERVKVVVSTKCKCTKHNNVLSMCIQITDKTVYINIKTTLIIELRILKRLLNNLEGHLGTVSKQYLSSTFSLDLITKINSVH